MTATTETPPKKPHRRKPLDPRPFAAVDPALWYAPADVAGLFGRTHQTVLKWVRAGKLAATANPLDPRSFLVRGADVLALAGPLLAAAAAGPGETAAARRKRAEAAVLKIRKGRAAG